MKTKSRIIYMLIMFFAILSIFIFFPTSNVKARTAQEFYKYVDTANGIVDAGHGMPKTTVCSAEDIASIAQYNPSLYYSNEFLQLIGKAVTLRKNGDIFTMDKGACVDPHNYSNYATYEEAAYYVRAIIDINLSGNGDVYVHVPVSKADPTGQRAIGPDTTAARWLYAAAYLASSPSDSAYKNTFTINYPAALGVGVSGALARARQNNTAKIPTMLSATDSLAGSKYEAGLNDAYNKGYLRYKGRFVLLDGYTYSSQGAVQSQVVFRGDTTNTHIKLEKVDEKGKALRGATFILYNTSLKKYIGKGNTLVSKASAQKLNYNPIVLQNLPAGKYVAQEVTAPRGYQKITSNISLSVTRNLNSSTDYDKVKNTKLPVYIKLQIYKYDTKTKKALKGAGFIIKNKATNKYLTKDLKEVAKNKAYTFTTDEKGEINIPKIKKATYIAYETKVPDGYVGRSTGVTLKMNAKTPIGNPQDTNIDLQIKKIDSKTKVPLKGAVFKIRDEKTKKYLNSSGALVAAQNAYKFTTNAKGIISIKDVPAGDYKAYEVEAPEGYTVSYADGISLEADDTTVIPNTKSISLTIKKLDDETNKPLQGAVFKIKDEKTGKYLNAKSELVAEAEAAEFTTDKDGLIEIDDVPIDATYVAYEIQAPEGYIVTEGNGIELEKNEVTEVYNTLKTLSFNIYKCDADNENKALQGAKFKIKNKTENKWLNSSLELDTEQKANIFVTDALGMIKLENLRNGEYEAYEVEAPTGYYVENANGITLVDDDTVTVPNKAESVDIEGTVFLDGGKGKTNIRNDICEDGEGINGVRVILKKDDEKVAEVSSGYDSRGNSTGKDGKYKFYGEDLKIAKTELSSYKVIFEYNGIKYENVATSFANNGSKASESSEDRSYMNWKYSTVTSNSKIDANGRSINNSVSGSTVEYKYSQYPNEGRYESKVIYETNAKDDKGHSYDNTYYANDKYHITASTQNAKYDLSKQNIVDKTISNVNFGIYERDLPDMAIKDKLYAAQVDLTRQDYGKTYSHVYEYNRNDNFDIKVRMSDVYNKSLERELYKSDILYNNQNQESLKLYLTYEIVVQNQNTSINTTVNNIVNYFDSGLTLVGVSNSASIDKNAGVINYGQGVQYSSVEKYNNEYNKVNINIGSNTTIYVRYQVNQEKLLSLVNLNPGQGVNIAANVSEINSCSAQKNGKPYTAIDNDSAVGNADPSRRLQTVEDDLGWAPDVNLMISSKTRITSGVVFEDHTDQEFKEGQERKGDGILNSQDTKRVSGVKVKLIDIGANSNVANVAYRYADSGISELTTETKNDGSYELSGFLPGNYVVVYQYGNAQYPVQQYQATIYDKNRESSNYKSHNVNWYKENVNTRYSDAMDVYDNFDEYYKLSMLNDGSKKRTDIEKTWANGDNVQHLKYDTSIDSNLKIDAFTPSMEFLYEKDNRFTENAENAAEPDYTINNIDFGIVERARYKVQVDDKINKILLKSSDGNTIKEIVPSADMNVPNVKYLPSTGRTSKTQKAVKGSLEMELDSEILQRAELYVEYGFTVTNKSELDYNTKDYYRNGTKGTDSNIVRVTVSNMINYVDNELFYDDNSQMLTDSTKNSDYKWNKMNWKTDASKWIAEDAREKLTNSSTNDSTYTTVLLGQYFDRSALKPGQTSQPTKLLVNRTLTPTQDDMKYSDWTEIVEVTKTWGREIYKQDTNGTFGETLGNFNPNQPDPADVNNKNPGTNKEPDFHYPEDIIIHPPTGISKSLILYTVLGITVLVVLAVGIIIIKKKALK